MAGRRAATGVKRTTCSGVCRAARFGFGDVPLQPRFPFAALGMEHRPTPPGSPRTDGRIERFDGRIEEIPQGHHFRSGEDPKTTLRRHVRPHDRQFPGRHRAASPRRGR